MGIEFQFCKTISVLEMDSCDAPQCECTSCHQTVHFKKVKRLKCAFYRDLEKYNRHTTHKPSSSNSCIFYREPLTILTDI